MIDNVLPFSYSEILDSYFPPKVLETASTWCWGQIDLVLGNSFGVWITEKSLSTTGKLIINDVKGLFPWKAINMRSSYKDILFYDQNTVG